MAKAPQFNWDREYRENVYWKEVESDYFEGDLKELIIKLNHLLKDAEEAGFDKVKFAHNWYYDSLTIYVQGSRFETDEEFNSRIENQKMLQANHEKMAKAKKDKEYKEYLRLARKYKDIN